MNTELRIADKRKTENNGIQSLFDTEVNIKIRVLAIVAIAAAVGNTLGFIANLALYGVNGVTAFCALCAVLMLLYLLLGLKSRYNVILGYAALLILDMFEFPLLTLTYGAVMYPYMIIGFHALVMITENKKRYILSSVLGVYDVAVIVYSSINPYIFGPQNSIGLLGSAVITFIITLLTVSALVIIWENVYLVDTAETDPVTKALNRTGFIKNVKKILSTDNGNDYVLLYFNVQSFKAINSIYGVDGGNAFLYTIASRLADAPFKPRLVARLNADHFVCLVNRKNYSADKLSDLFLIPFEDNGREVQVNLYCGIYEITDRNIPVSAMIDRASTTLKFIHREGNSHFAVYNNDVDTAYHEDTVVLGEIDSAISEGQFLPYYQPIVDCSTGKIVSAEALARWKHPKLGIVPPAVFIPVLEKNNLISNLDRLITKKVSAFIEERLATGKSIVPISINLSRDDLYDNDLISEILNIVEVHKDESYERHMYRFEVTESTYEDMSSHSISNLSMLRKNTAKILVDDFGRGFSSLGMITDYEFDIIKLDIQFARKIEENDKILCVIRGVIDMAHNLGAKVVAEGIENETQMNAVRDCGCDYAQGYYFYKPLPEEKFVALIEAENSIIS